MILNFRRTLAWLVALLAEGVDRNYFVGDSLRHCGRVALLAEGVDRNQFVNPVCNAVKGRPPRGGRG